MHVNGMRGIHRYNISMQMELNQLIKAESINMGNLTLLIFISISLFLVYYLLEEAKGQIQVILD